MNFPLKAALTVLVLASAFPASAAALEFSWYEQRAPGDASGEIRLEGLGEEDLRIDTPGRRMEIGIVRTGDVAIVNLAEPAGSSAPEGDARQDLVVVVTQGTANARAIYQLVMPAQEEPKPPAAAASSPPDPAGPEIPVVEQQQAAADVALQVPNGPAPSKIAPVPQVPAVASLEPGPSKSAGPLVCPVIAIRPGSLKSNIERLLVECGTRLGEWITGGEDRKYLKDWIVREPRVLAERNREGLHGLIELLYAEYRLQGLPSPDASAIDIYRIVNASTGEVE